MADESPKAKATDVLTVNRVLMALLIIVIFLDAWGTWQNNRILHGRDALFNELRREHADLKELCR